MAGKIVDVPTTYQIETGIPIPPDGRTKTGLSSTLRNLEVGQSFVVQDIKTASSAISYARQRLGRKLVVRSLGGGAARVWRTE